MRSVVFLVPVSNYYLIDFTVLIMFFVFFTLGFHSFVGLPTIVVVPTLSFTQGNILLLGKYITITKIRY